jgi:hypothetical protein
MVQNIENVQTFAGQTITISFWAKAAAANTLRVYVTQNFGSGGSANLQTQGTPDLTLTTNWARYSVTLAVPSVAGKTIGSGSLLAVQIYNPNNETSTIDLWGVQAEAGSIATPFQTATGTLQGELAACMRYYQKSLPQGTAPAANAGRTGAVENFAIRAAAATGISAVRLPVLMRAAPTVTIYNPSAAGNQARNLDTGTDCTATTVEAQADSSFRYFYTLPASTVSTNLISANYEASAEL